MIFAAKRVRYLHATTLHGCRSLHRCRRYYGKQYLRPFTGIQLSMSNMYRFFLQLVYLCPHLYTFFGRFDRCFWRFPGIVNKEFTVASLPVPSDTFSNFSVFLNIWLKFTPHYSTGTEICNLREVFFVVFKLFTPSNKKIRLSSDAFFILSF